MTLPLKELIAKVLNITSVETLDTNATLYRINNIRILQLNGYYGTNPATGFVPTDDRPSNTASGSGVSNAYDGNLCNSYSTIRIDANGDVHRMYSTALNNGGIGWSHLSSTGRCYGAVVWTVGGNT